MERRDPVLPFFLFALAVFALIVLAVLLTGRAHGQCYNGWCPSGTTATVRGPYGGGVDAWVGGGRGAGVSICGPQGCGVQVGPVRNAWPASMVKLISPRSVWSGAVVARDTVVTSAHSFLQSEATRTAAVFRDGTRIRCSVAARDEEGDCMLLRLESPAARRWVMRESLPVKGERILVYGFGGDGRPCSAVVSGIAAPGGTERWVWFTFSPGSAAQVGDSGGPIAGSDGRLIGIVSGVGTGVGTVVIRDLLAGLQTPPVPAPDADSPPITPMPDIDGRLGDLEGRVGVLEARPVVSLTRIERLLANHDTRLDVLEARPPVDLSEIEARLSVLEARPPVDLSEIEARLSALESRPQYVGFVDRYMTPDPDGEHEYKGRRYSLRAETQEQVDLGDARVTYYYPLEQSAGSASAANP